MKSERVDNLVQYVKGLKSNLDGKQLFETYKESIENVKPQEAFEVFYSLLEDGTTSQEILIFLDKVINAFYKSLTNYKWERPKNDSFLVDLYKENGYLVKSIDEIRILLTDTDLNLKKHRLLPKVKELEKINIHYLKKENILFPYLEKSLDKFNGLAIMWALHDSTRKQIKDTIEVLQDINSTEKDVNISIADLFFKILGLKKKEELILFPAAVEALSEDSWREMYKQSLEYGIAFEDGKAEHPQNIEGNEVFSEGKFKTDTGELGFKEIIMIFNALPVDLTFVDENNKVRYFTKPKDRIFPRSTAVIGRDLKNCHPPASVHVVEEIVESFRRGTKDTAMFWINLKGKMILIQYFALRDKEGIYKGVLEVSQDITEIKSLEGERRLLTWNKN